MLTGTDQDLGDWDLIVENELVLDFEEFLCDCLVEDVVGGVNDAGCVAGDGVCDAAVQRVGIVAENVVRVQIAYVVGGARVILVGGVGAHASGLILKILSHVRKIDFDVNAVFLQDTRFVVSSSGSFGHRIATGTHEGLPIPESSSNRGDLSAPAERMTSFFAEIVLFFPDASVN